MRQLRAGIVLLASALMTAPDGHAQEVRSPVAGTWKMSVLIQDQDIALAILRVEVKDGKAEATVVATGARTFSGAKVTEAKVEDRSLHLTFKTATSTFNVAAYGRKEERRPKTLTGSLEIRNNYNVVTLERTTDKELDQAEPASKTEGADELKTLNTKDDKERARILQMILEKFPGKPVAYAAAAKVWQQIIDKEPDAKTARAAAEDYLRVATEFGRELEIHAATQAAQKLLNVKNGAESAVALASRGAKLLTDADPPRRQLTVWKAAAKAIRRSDAEKYAPLLFTVNERIAKLEAVLDSEFEKTAIPFKLEPFGGRKDKSSRVAVVELFTGAHCPPCVAADIAFDALLKTYKPTEVVLLQYHLHVPEADPLTNADGEYLSTRYHVEGTPTIVVNGKVGPALGGAAKAAEGGYKEMKGLLDKALLGEAKAGLELTVKRNGDKIEPTVTLTALSTTKSARVVVLLVEDVVRYQGTNGQRLHHHVVRSEIADVEAKLPKGDAVPQKFTLSVNEVRKKLADYLLRYNRNDPFLDDERPLDLKRLKIVALVQEKESKEILHAVQVDVPEGK